MDEDILSRVDRLEQDLESLKQDHERWVHSVQVIEAIQRRFGPGQSGLIEKIKTELLTEMHSLGSRIELIEDILNQQAPVMRPTDEEIDAMIDERTWQNDLTPRELNTSAWAIEISKEYRDEAETHHSNKPGEYDWMQAGREFAKLSRKLKRPITASDVKQSIRRFRSTSPDAIRFIFTALIFCWDQGYIFGANPKLWYSATPDYILNKKFFDSTGIVPPELYPPGLR